VRTGEWAPGNPDPRKHSDGSHSTRILEGRPYRLKDTVGGQTAIHGAHSWVVAWLLVILLSHSCIFSLVVQP